MRSTGRAWGVLVMALTAAGCTGAPSHEASDEHHRLRAHFATVVGELQAADVSHLTADQRAARRAHIDALRRYRARGQFPHNHDFAEATPYFVDAHGTHCALAYLIAESGGDELVASIASSRNNARVRELADDASLVAWLRRAGLSTAEAARIQPLYECPAQRDCFTPDPEVIDEDYVFAGGVSVLTSGIAVGLNFPRATPRWRGWLALATGAAGVYVGSRELGSDGTMGDVALMSFASGLAAIAMGGKTLLFQGDDSKSQPDTPGLAVSPLLTDSGGGIVIGGAF